MSSLIRRAATARRNAPTLAFSRELAVFARPKDILRQSVPTKHPICARIAKPKVCDLPPPTSIEERLIGLPFS